MGIHVRLFGGMAPWQEEIAGQVRDEEVRDGGCPLGGRGREFETAAKQETESSRMAKLRFCGADEARTRDPRRDRPVF